MLEDEFAAPEYLLLKAALHDEEAALKLAKAPEGWRALDRRELAELGLDERHATAVRAMQELVRRSWPEIPREKLLTVDDIARIWIPRLGWLKNEVVLAVALDGDGYFLAEVQVGMNTGDGFGLQPATVLRSMIRAGAEAFYIVINSPSGEPRATPDLTVFCSRLQEAADVVGIRLVDVLVLGERDLGPLSLTERGLLDS